MIDDLRDVAVWVVSLPTWFGSTPQHRAYGLLLILVWSLALVIAMWADEIAIIKWNRAWHRYNDHLV